LIPVVMDPSFQQMDNPVVAMDGDLAETLSMIGDHVDTRKPRCIGLIVTPGSEVAFAQNLPESVHLEDASSIDEIISADPELVVIGPTALLRNDIRGSVIERILGARPGTRIICATGIRTDLQL
jgi:hypothetical protein